MKTNRFICHLLTYAILMFVVMTPLSGVVLAAPGSACIAPDNGGGTVDLPAPCPYVTYNDSYYIIAGLPAGSQIVCGDSLWYFSNIMRTPGGTLGGEIIQADAAILFEMVGTNALAGFHRQIYMPVTLEYHTAPRTPGNPVQSFDTDMRNVQGQVVGDPDFDLLRITAGTSFLLPSPGHTTLTLRPDGDWNVDSFFDITYRIDFVGAPSGPLAGMSGSTTGTVRIVQNGGSPWTPADGHKMHFPQLPDEAGWDVDAVSPNLLADDWQCSETGWVKDIHFWGSWRSASTDDILGFRVAIYEDVPAGVDTNFSHPDSAVWSQEIPNYLMTQILAPTPEGWYDPATGLVVSNDHFQYYQYDIRLDSSQWFWQTQGSIYWLSVTPVLANSFTQWGWKSSFAHFNDNAVYGKVNDFCPQPDSSGTVHLPANCPFRPDEDTMLIVNGLPIGTRINIDPTLYNIADSGETAGGALGGDRHMFTATLLMDMVGTGALFGYTRQINVPISLSEVHTAPRFPPAPVQSFNADWKQFFGQVTFDPDFDLLRITAGTDFGMPGPGQMTLTQLPSGQWRVDSFFDIVYRIDFVGAPGGPLAGMSGSTVATIRMQQGSFLIGFWSELYEPPFFTRPLDLAFVITGNCCSNRGNVDGIIGIGGPIDVADLTYLVAYLFQGGAIPPCVEAANVDGIVGVGGPIDVADLTYLVAYLFQGGAAPPPC